MLRGKRNVDNAFKMNKTTEFEAKVCIRLPLFLRLGAIIILVPLALRDLDKETCSHS